MVSMNRALLCLVSREGKWPYGPSIATESVSLRKNVGFIRKISFYIIMKCITICTNTTDNKELGLRREANWTCYTGNHISQINGKFKFNSFKITSKWHFTVHFLGSIRHTAQLPMSLISESLPKWFLTNIICPYFDLTQI